MRFNLIRHMVDAAVFFHRDGLTVRLLVCHCERSEAIARSIVPQEIASAQSARLAMTVSQ